MTTLVVTPEDVNHSCHLCFPPGELCLFSSVNTGCVVWAGGMNLKKALTTMGLALLVVVGYDHYRARG